MGSFISIGGRQDNIKRKLEGGGLTEFKELIEEFVSESFYVDGICKGCSDNCLDIMPIEFTKKDIEKYNKALKQLYRD